MEKRHVDVLVVGCRPAGASTSIALAKAGRRVLAIDRSSFPSDTLSTHLLFAGGVRELKELGALDRVLSTGAPKLPVVRLVRDGHDVNGRFAAIDEVDYGLCCRRPALDNALVDTARAAGVEVLEKTSIERIIWRNGRAAGAVISGADGVHREIVASLIVGADGRRSSVASMVGVEKPYRQDANQRGLVFSYGVEPRPAGERPDEIVQWRSADALGMYFPTDGGHGLTVLMPPCQHMESFRGNRSRTWAGAIAGMPDLAARIAPVEDSTKLRMSIEHPSFFRVSSGAGWALVGDAGHFKDPVVAQGIRDALCYGRRLGELTADALDDPAWLDRRLRQYEKERDLGCVQMYYFALREARTDPVGAVEAEMLADAVSDSAFATELAELFARSREMFDVLTIRRKARWVIAALRRPGADIRAIRREVARDAVNDTRLARDLRRIRRGHRPFAARSNRWSRDGWTPMLSAPPASSNNRSRLPAGSSRRADATEHTPEPSAAPTKVTTS